MLKNILRFCLEFSPWIHRRNKIYFGSKVPLFSQISKLTQIKQRENHAPHLETLSVILVPSTPTSWQVDSSTDRSPLNRQHLSAEDDIKQHLSTEDDINIVDDEEEEEDMDEEVALCESNEFNKSLEEQVIGRGVFH